jgi:superoxide reductase
MRKGEGEMTERLQVYKCEVCGNIVTVLHASRGQLVCCGQPMKLMVPNTVDAAKEKHVPVVERAGGKLKVKVGSVPHPMEEKHYIEWVTVSWGENCCLAFLKPGMAPAAEFEVKADKVEAFEYCNLHGYWKGEG